MNPSDFSTKTLTDNKTPIDERNGKHVTQNAQKNIMQKQPTKALTGKVQQQQQNNEQNAKRGATGC